MKKVFLLLAKLFMLVVWGMFVVNVINPFPGMAHVALNVIAIFTLFIHGLITLIFSKGFSAQFTLTTVEKISLLLFGTFALIDIKDKYLSEDVLNHQKHTNNK